MKVQNPITDASVNDWMTRNVITVMSDDTIHHAVMLMQENDIATIPVVGPRGECIGILSRSDLTELFMAEDEELSRVLDTPRLSMEWLYRTLDTCDVRHVRELMTHNVTTIKLDCPLSEACNVFVKQSIHHLPVVDEDDRVVGMLSTYDVVKAISRLKI